MISDKFAKRNSALDITRIFATFCVVSIHFFRNSGFYQESMSGGRMYLMCLGRAFFMICVPLFVVLTGYLMNKKTLCKKYYKGITKTLAVYVLASIACMLYAMFFRDTPRSAAGFVMGILNFSGAPYSWYVEMYIGLFLIIPFLNLAYNGLTSQKHKLVLVATMLVLTTLPSMLNIFDFHTAGWWKTPAISYNFAKLVPEWWTAVYPITYYFAGCYLSEFKPKMNKVVNLLLIIVFTVLFGSFDYYRSYSETFRFWTYNDWGGIQSVVLTVLVFMYINNHSTEKVPVGIKWFLAQVSDLCFGAYLVSYIFDMIAYERLNSSVSEMVMRMEYYPVTALFVFVCSLLLSFVLNMIYKAGAFSVSKIKKGNNYE